MTRGGTLAIFAAAVLTLAWANLQAGPGDWPQWRGPNRDAKVTGFTPPATWPKALTQKWKTTVGLGEASPVLVGDKVYAFGQQGGDEVLSCLDAASGKVLWDPKYRPAQAVTGAPTRGGHTGPRCTPVVADGKVCTLGVSGKLSCVEATTGKVVWQKDTKPWPQFFTASSPLIADGKCIAFTGGRGNGELGAYDLTSGEAKWTWPGEGPGYGSPVLMTVDGTTQVVALTEASLVGVGLADGKLLWQVPYRSRYNSNTPIIDGQTVICSAPQGGTVAVKVEKKGDGFTGTQLWKKSDVVASMYNTPVLKDGLLFGLTAGTGGQGPTRIFCLNAQTGDTLWTDTTQRGECGTILDAGPVLLAVTSDGNLLAFKPSKTGYEEVAKYKVADTPSWSCPIVTGNRVFVKDRDAVTLWTIE